MPALLRTIPLAVATVLSALAGPVSAAPPPAPADAGKVGVHQLLDLAEYPGVTCRYRSTSGALRALHIRRPVAFGRDLGPRVDRTMVGWRWQVFGTAGAGWEMVTQGPLVKLAATEHRNARFAPAVVSLDAVEYDAYRVRHRLTWYAKGSSTKVLGSAVHWVTRYAKPGALLSPSIDQCYGLQPPGLPPEVPPGHTGTYGTHLLIDSSEHPGLGCVYRGTGAPLTRMWVSPVIAFAPDATKRPDRTTVARRVVVQWSDSEAGDDWTTWRRLPLERRTPSDTRNAVFPRTAVALAGVGPTHARWRLLTTLRFFDEADALFGKVTEPAAWSWQDDGDPATIELGHCGGRD